MPKFKKSQQYVIFKPEEFNEEKKPEFLLKAISAHVPSEWLGSDDPIEQLNSLLQKRDLYKYLKNYPVSAKYVIDKLEKGESLDVPIIVWWNRVLVETNFPLWTLKRKKYSLNQVRFYIGLSIIVTLFVVFYMLRLLLVSQ